MTELISNPILVKGELSLKIHRSKPEIEELRDFWIKEQRHPNSDLDHFLLVCSLRPEVISPCALSVWLENKCRCIVAARIGHVCLRPQVGYLKMPIFRVTALTVIHEGVIGTMTAPYAAVIAEGFRKLLDEHTIRLVEISNIPETSAVLTYLRSREQRILSIGRPRFALHRELTLGSQPGFLVQAMKSKHRSWFRKKSKDLDAAFNGQIAWRWYSSISDVSALCGQIEKVAAQTYQRGLDAGFKDDLEHQERLSLFARQGRLRIMILEASQQPVAFWFGVVYGGTFHSEATGYVGKLGEYEVGTQIFLNLVDELVKEGVGRFDFGLGDAAYKHRFGDRCWCEFHIRIFGPGWKNFVMKCYLRVFDVCDKTLRGLVQKFGLIDRLKRVWRRRLAASAKPA